MPEPIDAAPGTTDYTTQLRQHIADAIEDTVRRHTSPQPGPMYGTLPTGATMHELADAVLDVVGPELARWKSAGSAAPMRIITVRPYRTWYGRRFWRFECSECVRVGIRCDSDTDAIAGARVHIDCEHAPDRTADTIDRVREIAADLHGVTGARYIADALDGALGESTQPPRDGAPLTASQANTGSDGPHQPLPPERPSRGRAEPRYSCTAHPHFATSCPAVIDQHDREAHADDQQRTLHTAPCPAISEGECTCGAMASAMAIAEALPLPRKVCSATRTRSEGGSSDSVHEVCWATYGHDGPHGPWRRRPLPGSFDSGAPRGLLASFLDDVVRHTPPPDLIRVGCPGCARLTHPGLTCVQAAADRTVVQEAVDRAAEAFPDGDEDEHPNAEALAAVNRSMRLQAEAAALRPTWNDADPLMDAVSRAVWEHCTTSGPSHVVDDPRNIAAAAVAAMRARPHSEHELREAVRKMARVDPGWARRLLEGTTR